MPLHILYVWNGNKHSTTFFCVVNINYFKIAMLYVKY